MELQLINILLIAGFVFLTHTAIGHSQTVVDKMLVTVSDGVRTELITHSDLFWRLALEPDVPAIDSPSASQLNETLQRVIEQRLIALEAERLPSVAPTEEEVKSEIRRLVALFPSAANFEARLRRIGFESTNDPNFERIIEQRLAIEKYLNFRFRSFVVIAPQDEEKYYNETFVLQFKRANPGLVVPSIEQIRSRLNQELTERKVATDIEQFLAEARERAVITTLNSI